MYFKWNGKKISWYGQEFSQSFLPTANFLCLQVPPVLLLPVQNLERKGNCWHHFSHESVDNEGIQEEQGFLLIPKWEDWWLGKMKFIIYIPPQKHFLTFTVSGTINLCAWRRGTIVQQFMLLGQQHCKAVLMPHIPLQVLEGTCYNQLLSLVQISVLEVNPSFLG